MRACKGRRALRQFQLAGLFGHGGGCNGLVLSWLRLGDGKTILFASLVGGEDEHPFHVPSYGHEVPLAPDVIDSTQHELPEALRLPSFLYDAEHFNDDWLAFEHLCELNDQWPQEELGHVRDKFIEH